MFRIDLSIHSPSNAAELRELMVGYVVPVTPLLNGHFTTTASLLPGYLQNIHDEGLKNRFLVRPFLDWRKGPPQFLAETRGRRHITCFPSFCNQVLGRVKSVAANVSKMSFSSLRT